jgi:hypothetical protein
MALNEFGTRGIRVKSKSLVGLRIAESATCIRTGVNENHTYEKDPVIPNPLVSPEL